MARVAAYTFSLFLGGGPLLAAVSAPPAPDAGSPLVTDGQWVYATGEGGRVVLCRPLVVPYVDDDIAKREQTAWRKLRAPAFGRIVGLAAASNALFVADGTTNEITRLVPGSAQPQRLRPGRALGEIAYAGGLFGVDTSTGDVFRVAGEDSSFPIALASMHGPTRTLLASDGTALLVTHPDVGDMHYVVNVNVPAPASRVVYSRDAAGVAISTKSTIQQRPFPVIQRPGRTSIFRGIVYVVDEADGKLYAMSRRFPPQPVSCVLQMSVAAVRPSAVSSVVASETALTVIMADGPTEQWRRLVPTELVLKATDHSAALPQVLRYLFRNGILPTRSAPETGEVDAAAMSVSLFGIDIPAVKQLLCALNLRACAGDRVRVAPGGRLTVPDLSYERFIKLVEVNVPTMEAAVAATKEQVVSPPFVPTWTGVDVVAKQNPRWRSPEASGTPVLLPAEFLRYIVPMGVDDIPAPGPPPRGEAGLRDLEDRGLIHILSLEEHAPEPSFNGGAPLAPPWDSLQRAHDEVARAISFARLDPSPHLVWPNVGIAEAYIEVTNPDFCVGQACAFAPYPGRLPEVAGDAGESGVTRPAAKADHGTMVAGAVGARQTRFQRQGFAPDVTLNFVHSETGQLENDINNAATLNQARIFNVSASYEQMPKDLLKPLSTSQYLFVVAAGKYTTKMTGEVCVDPDVYPVCHLHHPNMIVVTSTTRDGKQLIIPDGDKAGACWSADRVDVAAPAEGFYLPARRGGYAPTDGGSSFAVPLVTATAAVLDAQLRASSPFAIRARIVATADMNPGLRGKVRGGLLNMRRAITKPYKALLDDERECEIDSSALISFGQVTGAPLAPMPLRNVLRLHLWPPHRRLVYVSGDRINVEDDVFFANENDSKFTCKAADGTTSDLYMEDFMDYVGPVLGR